VSQTSQAMTTFACVASLPLLATRPALRRALPPNAIKWSKVALGAGLLQVTMGITTLLMLVPVPLAAAHQAGSVVLLTTMLGLLGTLRRPSRISRMWAEAKRNGTSFSAGTRTRLSAEALKGVKSGMEARVNIP
jgi:cytochrome c oxidase assembly protein subunit 15